MGECRREVVGAAADDHHAAENEQGEGICQQVGERAVHEGCAENAGQAVDASRNEREGRLKPIYFDNAGVYARVRPPALELARHESRRPAIAAHVGPVDEPYAVVPCARGWADANWDICIRPVAYKTTVFNRLHWTIYSWTSSAWFVWS